MNGLHFIATGHAVPKRILTNDDLSKMVDTNDEWIRTRTGIRQRHVCEEESCVSLAHAAAENALEQAAERLLEENGKDAGYADVAEAKAFLKTQIAVVIVATATSDYAFPSAACMIQKLLELPNDVMSFDLSAACSGFLYSLDVCRGLLANARKPYALVIGSEQLSRIVDYTDRGSCILFGDGAGAAIVSLADQLYVQRNWSSGDKEALFCRGAGCNDAHLNMEGNRVFKFAVTVLQEAVNQVLEDAGITMADVDYVICHQANIRIIEYVQKKYPGYEDKFYINIDRYGNTSAASIPICIDEMRRGGILKEGMKVICVGFGAGFTWSGTLFTI